MFNNDAHLTFRQLFHSDAPIFFNLIIAAYQENRKYEIVFDAMNTTLAESEAHILTYPVFGGFIENELVTTVTLRLPWSNSPGPLIMPHIGRLATHPCHRGKRYSTMQLNWLEETILISLLKSSAYTLGTASHHPWLIHYYQQLGFKKLFIKDLGKKHKTLFMKKELINKSV